MDVSLTPAFTPVTVAAGKRDCLNSFSLRVIGYTALKRGVTKTA
jgi:hypothetical protein